MENAVEGLKMAGSVLLFVIALSVAILTFTQSRETIDTVLKYSDREYLTIQNDSRFYYLKSNDTQRYVGKETIIPAIYRAYKENFKIIFYFPNSDCLYRDKTKISPDNEISKIDLAQEGLGIGSDLDSRVFLYAIIYGTTRLNNYNNEYKTIYNKKFSNIEPLSGGLYDYITNNVEEGSYKIKEELGTYYIEDVKKNALDTSISASVEDVNKNEKRVITYTFVPK